MRRTSWFVVGLGSAFLWSSLAFAQDAQRPVQVIIGPTGVKVIDPRTGKEVPSVVTKIPTAPPRIAFELEADKKKEPRVVELDLQLDPARGEIRGADIHKATQGHKTDKIEIHQMEFQIVPGPDGKARIIALHAPHGKEHHAGLSTDKNIDLLLREMAELRHDMHEIKQKLGAGGGRPWGMWGPSSGFGWKWNAEEKKEPETKKERGKDKASERDFELERRFEHLLREAEELRREIRKQKERNE
ncbi:MAG TPA: hypothetical protein VFE62_15655 [Gemmataceae bacterium]|nr:hypothetical protein [Gemmataceae bacterium]